MNFKDLTELPVLISDYLTENADLNKSIDYKDLEEIQLPLSRGKSGKGFRKLLLLSLCDYLGIEIKADDTRLIIISKFIDLLHNSSLLIDDIEDSSKTRRNEPCAYIQYGVALTLNCGTFGIFKGVDELITCMDSDSIEGLTTEMKYEILKIINEEIMHLHIGQGLEIYWRDISLNIPEMESYIKMIRMKTSGMLRIMARLFLKFFNIPNEKEQGIIKLMDYIGIVYQIRDDYLNLSSKEATDILEGKFSFPILLGINKELEETNKSQIYDIVTKKYKFETDIELVLDVLEKQQSLKNNEILVNNLVSFIISHFQLKKDTPINYLLSKLEINNDTK
ncbi:terpenoid synthase [Hanseniaspora valbyensis NRRL Y-1626]|uniref:Terpenoid synthase n=1 Tax=Hanseniaspora valbyensis NRRL Y-1626 TaxID=766949 RepID=A0A1B7TEU5_9ASCO|nr:terpenoid synthase [Hanseniaspora valbyensis NRRL Y-1626]